MTTRIPAGAVWALGFTQIIGYGTLYYSFSALTPAIGAEFGWAPEWIFGALSVGLLCGGLVSPLSGYLADRLGAGRTMVLGSTLASLTLLAASVAPSGPAFAVALVAMEMASTLVLYAAAFAALVQLGDRHAQRSMTHLTLIAGFASTIFWPLTTTLMTILDWREIYLVFAGLNLVVCAPLHLWLARKGRAPQTITPSSSSPVAERTDHLVANQQFALVFGLLLFGFAIEGFILAAVLLHLIPLLGTLGLAGSSILISTLFGPAQVLSRLTNMVFGRELRQTHLAIIAAVLLPLGVAVLTLTAPSPIGGIVFAVIFGLGSGLTSIVSGSLPLELFGRHRYAYRLGWLSSARQLASSVAPFALALVMAGIGPTMALQLLVGLGVLSVGAFLLAAAVAASPRPTLSASA